MLILSNKKSFIFSLLTHLHPHARNTPVGGGVRGSNIWGTILKDVTGYSYHKKNTFYLVGPPAMLPNLAISIIGDFDPQKYPKNINNFIMVMLYIIRSEI